MRQIIGPDIDPRYESLVPVHFLNGLGLAAATKRTLKDIRPYLSYFPKPTGSDEPYNKGELIRTGKVLQLIDQRVRNYYTDTTRFANGYIAAGLDPKSPSYKKQVGQRTYQWLINHIQYKQDREGREELRRPARAVFEAKTGIDCDCFTYFVSTVLTNLGIPHYLRIIAVGEATAYHHIYVVIPEKWGKPCRPYTDKANYTVVDPVLDTFDREPEDIRAYHDYPMTIPKTALAGLGYTALDDLLEKVKQTRRLMTQNPQSYIAAGINPNVAIPLLTQAINAWNTPQRDIVLAALAKQEAAMYIGLKGVPMNGLLQNIAKTVSQVATNVANTVKTAVTEPGKLVNQAVDAAKDLIDKAIDYGRTGVLFLPRKAYMALVALNVRGFAQKLKKGMADPATFDRIKRVWEGDLGGDMSNLVNVANEGADRPFLFGLGSLNGDPVTVASLLASAGGIIATMKPIMDLIDNLVNTVSSAGKAIEAGKEVAQLFTPSKAPATEPMANTQTPGANNILVHPNANVFAPPETPPGPGEPQYPYPNTYPTPPPEKSNTGKTILLVGGGVLSAFLLAKAVGGNTKKSGSKAGLSGIKNTHHRHVHHTRKAPVKAHVKF